MPLILYLSLDLSVETCDKLEECEYNVQGLDLINSSTDKAEKCQQLFCPFKVRNVNILGVSLNMNWC